MKVKDKYYLYTEWPIGSMGDDYGPMSVAVAEHPEGPWAIYPNNLILEKGEWGEWDDGGISEAEVLYSAGVFHLFYGGTKLYEPHIASRENIGYAYSFDGYQFEKYGLNPVATRDANPDAASFSEVHSILEPPYVYLYHTLRYKEPRNSADEKSWPLVEKIGVQIFVLQRPFSLYMLLLHIDTLAPLAQTKLLGCPPVSLSQVGGIALTAECRYSPKASRLICIHVRSSPDGYEYNTSDLFVFDKYLYSGETIIKTFNLITSVRFIKIIVENLDESESVSEIKITITQANT